jgi:hypothetical protein
MGFNIIENLNVFFIDNKIDARLKKSADEL